MPELTNLPGSPMPPQGQSEATTNGSQVVDTPVEQAAPAQPVEPMVRRRDLQNLQSRLQQQINHRDSLLQQYEQRLRAAETADLDEDQLRVYHLTERARQLEQREAALREQEQGVEKIRLFNQINQQTGIPVQFLEETAESPDHAWSLGAQYMNLLYQQQLGGNQVQQQSQRRQLSNASVDLGQGNAPSSDPMKAYEDAVKSGDGVAAARAYRIARDAQKQQGR